MATPGRVIIQLPPDAGYKPTANYMNSQILDKRLWTIYQMQPCAKCYIDLMTTRNSRMKSIADKALWIIERNSDRDLNINAIAHACNVSRSHLANAFGSATGLSVIKYLRSRRLSQSAQVLADGAPDILSVAFDAGYNSHEAFTRAFRDEFSITPESVRERKSIHGLTLTPPLALRPRTSTRLPAPRFEKQEKILMVGLSELCSFETTITIPAQWQRFMTYYGAIPHKTQAIPVGLNQALDDDGQFRYLCGVEVTRFADTLPALDQVEIAPSCYVVFEHNGHVSTLYETYATIWNEALPALDCEVAEAPVLERHNPIFDPQTGEGGLTLWIPLAQSSTRANPAKSVREQ